MDRLLLTQVAPAGISLKTALDPYYPPTLTGMRASHKGSFEVAHALAWQGKKPANTRHWTSTTT